MIGQTEVESTIPFLVLYGLLCAGIVWLNLRAVRKKLAPLSDELGQLLTDLPDKAENGET